MADDAGSPLWRTFLTAAGRILAAVQVGFVASGHPPRRFTASDGDPAWDEILARLDGPDEPVDQAAPDGTPLEWRGAPVTDDGATPLGVLWAAWRREAPPPADAAANLRHLADVTRPIWHAQADRDYRQALLRTVTHEMRTPLTVIKGYLDLLRTQHPLPAGLRARADNTMREQAGRMEQVIREMALATGLRLPRGANGTAPLAGVAAPVLQRAGIIVDTLPPAANRPVPATGTRQLLESLCRVLPVIGHPIGPTEADWDVAGPATTLRLTAANPTAPIEEIRAVLAHEPPTGSACRHGWTLALVAVQAALAGQGGRLTVTYADERLTFLLTWPQVGTAVDGLAA